MRAFTIHKSDMAQTCEDYHTTGSLDIVPSRPKVIFGLNALIYTTDHYFCMYEAFQ